MLQKHPDETYTNVSFDLIDLSDDTAPSPRPGVAKPSNTNARNDVSNGRVGKPPLSKQPSSPDYVVVDKSRNNYDDTSSDYVIVPPRGLYIIFFYN